MRRAMLPCAARAPGSAYANSATWRAHVARGTPITMPSCAHWIAVTCVTFDILALTAQRSELGGGARPAGKALTSVREVGVACAWSVDIHNPVRRKGVKPVVPTVL